MSRNVGILMLLVLQACGAPRDPATVEQAVVDAGTPPRSSSCSRDADCNEGMICEGCGDGFFTCVPGCRQDAECGLNMVCNHQIACLTCPCPSGYCDLDPCRDLDGDGYTPLESGTCPGKLLGDCNDSNFLAHPGGRERCANGVDDDCDGRRDTADDACRVCDASQSYCSSSINCGGGRFCDLGCCEQCPVPVNPQCDPGQCLLPGGKNANGCYAGSVCGDCTGCSTNYEPVCGRNFSTYGNACLARAAGTPVLHTGECGPNEGVPCGGPWECNYGQFCRDFGASQQCALIGTCTVDTDCAAVVGVPTCGDAGVGTWTCKQERCAASCP